LDPENENRVFSVFTYVNVLPQDGGKNFEELMPAMVFDNGVTPPTTMHFWIQPDNWSIYDGW